MANSVQFATNNGISPSLKAANIFISVFVSASRSGMYPELNMTPNGEKITIVEVLFAHREKSLSCQDLTLPRMQRRFKSLFFFYDLHTLKVCIILYLFFFFLNHEYLPIHLLWICTYAMVHKYVEFRAQFLWVPSLIACWVPESKVRSRLCSRWLYLLSHLAAWTPFFFRGNVLKDASSCYSWHDRIFIWNTYNLCIKQNFEFCGSKELCEYC